MVPKLLRRLARRPAATSGEHETPARERPATERRGRSGPVRKPLPTSWVKMHVWSRDRGRCVLCGSQERVWFDYIVAVEKGGSNSERNIRLMCEHCKRHGMAASTRRKKRRT
jgi:5-methylcytosine-specific restriction endonuclease McrA